MQLICSDVISKKIISLLLFNNLANTALHPLCLIASFQFSMQLSFSAELDAKIIATNFDKVCANNATTWSQCTDVLIT